MTVMSFLFTNSISLLLLNNYSKAAADLIHFVLYSCIFFAYGAAVITSLAPTSHGCAKLSGGGGALHLNSQLDSFNVVFMS